MATRETWLESAQTQLETLFNEHGHTFPHHARVSVGFPSRGGLSTKNKTIGQCWDPITAKDGKGQIFISPLLDNGVEVLAVLVHELVHHSVGCEHGHKGPFKRCAKAVGLEGKMTATHAGPQLTERLNGLLSELGEYPHAALDPKAGKKKEGTRLLKIVCQECGWVGRTTQKCIDMGLPVCACGNEIEVA